MGRDISTPSAPMGILVAEPARREAERALDFAQDDKVLGAWLRQHRHTVTGDAYGAKRQGRT
jgi:hypothetical protein